jgi:hypothetical protein
MGFRSAAQTGYGMSWVKNFAASITGDTEIDEESRADLLRQVVESQGTQTTNAAVSTQSFRGISGGKAKQLMNSLAKAREGTDPLYATRRLFQNRRQSVLAQPGRSQTVLTR